MTKTVWLLSVLLLMLSSMIERSYAPKLDDTFFQELSNLFKDSYPRGQGGPLEQLEPGRDYKEGANGHWKTLTKVNRGYKGFLVLKEIDDINQGKVVYAVDRKPDREYRRVAVPGSAPYGVPDVGKHVYRIFRMHRDRVDTEVMDLVALARMPTGGESHQFQFTKPLSRRETVLSARELFHIHIPSRITGATTPPKDGSGPSAPPP